MEDIRKVCSKRLKAIEGNITPQDKLDAMEALEISRMTLDKYLQGNPSKIETAITLIQFLEKRIKDRLNELQVA